MSSRGKSSGPISWPDVIIEDVEKFLRLPKASFDKGKLCDDGDHFRTVIVLHSLFERAIKATFDALLTQQVGFVNDGQSKFFALVSNHIAGEVKTIGNARSILLDYVNSLQNLDPKATLPNEISGHLRDFEAVTAVRNRYAHDAIEYRDATIAKVSNSALTIDTLWERTYNAVQACYRLFCLAPDAWESIAEQEAGYDAWIDSQYETWRAH